MAMISTPTILVRVTRPGSICGADERYQTQRAAQACHAARSGTRPGPFPGVTCTRPPAGLKLRRSEPPGRFRQASRLTLSSRAGASPATALGGPRGSGGTARHRLPEPPSALRTADRRPVRASLGALACTIRQRNRPSDPVAAASRSGARTPRQTRTRSRERPGPNERRRARCSCALRARVPHR